MNRKLIVKLAMTMAFVVTLSTSCTNVVSGGVSNVASAGQKKMGSLAVKAEAELAEGKVDKAIMFAETAVEADLQNSDYRALLARAYMADGRFASAERTLMDVIELGQVDPRTIISLALSRIAQGRINSAVSLVEANRSIIPASDYALTLALAGQQKEAIEILSESIRADNGNARTRQNLALAYALDGRWRDARVMATQDMAQDRVNERIAEWAQYARPNAYQARIAGLLKVTPRADDGQPFSLALNTVSGTFASAEPEVTSETTVAMAEVPAATVELAALGPAPSAGNAPGFAAVESGVRMTEVEPSIFAETPPFAAPASAVGLALATPQRVAEAYAEMTNSKPTKLALSEATNGYIVQLGAFSSAMAANEAWDKFNQKYSVLAGSISSSSVATINGRKLVRLAAAGFDSQSSANAVCRTIKAKGGDCIVKASGSLPVRLASR